MLWRMLSLHRRLKLRWQHIQMDKVEQKVWCLRSVQERTEVVVSEGENDQLCVLVYCLYSHLTGNVIMVKSIKQTRKENDYSGKGWQMQTCNVKHFEWLEMSRNALFQNSLFSSCWPADFPLQEGPVLLSLLHYWQSNWIFQKSSSPEL